MRSQTHCPRFSRVTSPSVAATVDTAQLPKKWKVPSAATYTPSASRSPV
jgi:hypothetical protein